MQYFSLSTVYATWFRLFRFAARGHWSDRVWGPGQRTKNRFYDFGYSRSCGIKRQREFALIRLDDFDRCRSVDWVK